MAMCNKRFIHSSSISLQRFALLHYLPLHYTSIHFTIYFAPHSKSIPSFHIAWIFRHKLTPQFSRKEISETSYNLSAFCHSGISWPPWKDFNKHEANSGACWPPFLWNFKENVDWWNAAFSILWREHIGFRSMLTPLGNLWYQKKDWFRSILTPWLGFWLYLVY